MLNTKLICFSLIATLLLSGCSEYTDNKIITVSENKTTESYTGIIYDGTYLYDYDFTTNMKSNKRIPLVEDYSQSLYLYTPDDKTYFETVNDYQFTGDYNSVMTYVDKLKANSYSITEYTTNSKYVDIKLSSDKDSVRVIYTEPMDIKIFCVSPEGISSSIPYINEKN